MADLSKLCVTAPTFTLRCVSDFPSDRMEIGTTMAEQGVGYLMVMEDGANALLFFDAFGARDLARQLHLLAARLDQPGEAVA
jgi:hypothetical protein